MNEGRREPGEPYPLSVWAFRLLAAVTLLLAISLVWIWIEAFYRGISANVQLSFKSFDLPVLTGDTVHHVPIIGHHYFSDFQVPFSYALDFRHSVSPYLRPAPEQYPPFNQALFVPFTFISLHTSTVIYLAVSAVVLLVPLWLLLAPVHALYRVIFLIPVVVLTTPFISVFDRGNNVGITVGLVAWAIWAWKTERWILCGVVLAAAIGFKGYPLALLVVPFAFRRYKFTALVAAGAVAGNLVFLAFYAGGFSRNLREVLPAIKGGVGPSNLLYSWSLYSFIPKTAGLLVGRTDANRLLAQTGSVLWVPAVAYMIGLYFVIRRGRVPQWCWGPLVLASIQLLVPASYVYTTVWAVVAAVWFAMGRLVELPDDVPHPGVDAGFVTLRVLLLLALTVTLTPSVFTVSGADGFETPLARYLSPALIFLTLVVAVVQSIPAAPTRSRTELVDSSA